MSLSKAGMLVKLTRNSWYGFTKDKAATEAAKTAAGATARDAGSFNKRLLPTEALKHVRNIENKIYAKHCDMTVPWYFNGMDFLPTKLFLQYTQIMRELKDQHATAVNALVLQYPLYKVTRAKELGSMFNEEDYPPPDVLRESFNIDIKFMPVPDAGDFRIELENEELDRLRKGLEKDLTTAQHQAMSVIWDRVVQTLDHMYERLSDPERVFRDSLIDNAGQLSELLPGFNVVSDSRLETVANIMSTRVCAYGPQRLRDDPNARSEVVRAIADALEIARKVKDENK